MAKKRQGDTQNDCPPIESGIEMVYIMVPDNQRDSAADDIRRVQNFFDTLSCQFVLKVVGDDCEPKEICRKVKEQKGKNIWRRLE